jgi:hypothetical protein
MRRQRAGLAAIEATKAVKRTGLGLICIILLTGCEVFERLNPSPLTMKITPRRADTRIEPVVWGDSVLLNIHSDFGIDTAEVEFTERPTSVVLRLYLQNLEGMGFAYGEKRIRVSLSMSSSLATFRQGIVLDGKEETLTSASPYWMPAKVVWKKGKPQTIQYIEIAVPQDFLAGEYQKFTISWIDAYRR